jgi:TfoX N-terminal domain
MANKAASTIPADRIEAYDRLIATRPGVERKGATIPYTSLNGHMTSYLADAGSLVLRLSPDDRARFLDDHGTTLHTAYGVVQKEFVDVPDDLFADTAAMAPWFAASLDWVGSLKPKPTKRPG